MANERLTPFMLFFCEHKDAVQASKPSAAPHEVSQMIAEQWKSLSAEKARAYSVLSATYTEQKKTTAAPAKKRKDRKEKDPKAPKSATSAYMYFSKHHRMLLKQENSDLTFGDLGKTVGAMWKAATPEEKRPFEELAAEDKTRYVNELSDYKKSQEADAASAPPPSNSVLSSGGAAKESSTTTTTTTTTTDKKRTKPPPTIPEEDEEDDDEQKDDDGLAPPPAKKKQATAERTPSTAR